MKRILDVNRVLRRIHNDEKGGVSLETILIIGAIALPILIFLITVAWPRVKTFFEQGMTDLENGSINAQSQ
jgi:Flp pilus assembly pilin Flp